MVESEVRTAAETVADGGRSKRSIALPEASQCAERRPGVVFLCLFCSALKVHGLVLSAVRR